MRAKSLQLCLTLCNPMNCAPLQAPLSMGFSRQEHWSGLPCFPHANILNPGIELASPVTPTLQVDYFGLSHQGSPSYTILYARCCKKQITVSTFNLHYY